MTLANSLDGASPLAHIDKRMQHPADLRKVSLAAFSLATA